MCKLALEFFLGKTDKKTLASLPLALEYCFTDEHNFHTTICRKYALYISVTQIIPNVHSVTSCNTYHLPITVTIGTRVAATIVIMLITLLAIHAFLC